jgi:hypothetical protein
MFPSSRLFRFAVLASLGALLLCGKAPAADDIKKPYQLRIVLHLARNRLLTEVFRKQLERELKDGLQAALGKLAQVEVVSGKPKDPALAAKLDDILARGLRRALDDWRERSKYKTHFLLIDFSGTRYEIQARQHDGLTGLASPAVRRERTRDRAYVARAAALLVERDLGLLGMIETEPDVKGRVRVQLKGGGLGVDLARWVKKDEVMAVVRVSGNSSGQQMPWTFLQVDTPPSEGVCTCRLFRRYPRMQVKGMRCVLLGTRSGSLRLRVMEEAPGGQLTELKYPATLQFRHRGFEGEDANLLKMIPLGTRILDTGRFEEKGKFNRIAFVTVMDGSQRKARIPIALVDDRVILLPIPAGDEESTQALERYRLLRRSVIMSYMVQTELFKEINDLTAKPAERPKALQRVKETLKRAREDHTKLSKERDEVEKEIDALKLNPKEKPSFRAINQRLKLISSAESDLLKHIKLLDKIEKEESNPEKKEAKFQIEGAKLLEKEFELGKAIAAYKKVPEKLRPEGLNKHIADLEKRWEPKNEEHKKARYFIYRVWPTLDTAGMAEQIKKAEEAFEQCKKVSDTVGPRKMQLVNDKHRQRIEKEVSELNPTYNIDDDKPARLIKELVPKLQKLDGDIRAFLDSKTAE